MAVVAVWKCDRDNTMFENKKDAEEYDRMLELAANITALIEQSISGIDEEHSEKIGLLLAKNSENLAKACKGKPSILLEKPVDETNVESSKSNDSVADIELASGSATVSSISKSVAN